METIRKTVIGLFLTVSLTLAGCAVTDAIMGPRPATPANPEGKSQLQQGAEALAESGVLGRYSDLILGLAMLTQNGYLLISKYRKKTASPSTSGTVATSAKPDAPSA